MKQPHLIVNMNEDSTTAGCNCNTSGSQAHVWSRPQDIWNPGCVHPSTGGPCGLIQEAPHMNKDSTPIAAFLLFFMKVIQLFVAETNKYYS
jgi:hypothetical protein